MLVQLRSSDLIGLGVAQIAVAPDRNDPLHLRTWDCGSPPLGAADLRHPVYCAAKPLIAAAFVDAMTTLRVPADTPVGAILPWVHPLLAESSLDSLLTNRTGLRPPSPPLTVTMNETRRRTYLATEITPLDEPLGPDESSYDDSLQWLVMDHIVRSLAGIALADLAFAWTARGIGRHWPVVLAQLIEFGRPVLWQPGAPDALGPTHDGATPSSAWTNPGSLNPDTPSHLTLACATGLAIGARKLCTSIHDGDEFAAWFWAAQTTTVDRVHGHDVHWGPGLSHTLGRIGAPGFDAGEAGFFAQGGAAITWIDLEHDIAAAATFDGLVGPADAARRFSAVRDVARALAS